MVESKNFVEKELGKTLDEEQQAETIPAQRQEIPIYTPPPPPMQEPIPPEPQIIQQPPIVQIVEKIVYKKQRVHGFFRTLTIIALLAIGFLMLGESTGMIELSINTFKLHQIYPLVIILSTIILRSYKKLFGKLFGLILFLGVFGGIFAIGIYTSLNPTTKRSEGTALHYSLQKDSTKAKQEIYIQTLLGNSSIKGQSKTTGIQGTRNSDRQLFVQTGTENDKEYLKLREDKNRNVLQNYRSNIDLQIAKTVTIDTLYIKNFLGLHTIDLSGFQRKNLKFHAGIDDITIDVGNVFSGNSIDIQGSAANITLNIPNNIGVIMHYKDLLGILEAPEFDEGSGHIFQSQNLNEAKTVLNVYINLGIGNTKIHRVDTK